MSRTTEYAKLYTYNHRNRGTVEAPVNNLNCQMNNLKQVAGEPAASVPRQCGMNPSQSLCPGGNCNYMQVQQPLYPQVNHGYNALTYGSTGGPYYPVNKGPYAQPCSNNNARLCAGKMQPNLPLKPVNPFPVMPRSRPRPRPIPHPGPHAGPHHNHHKHHYHMAPGSHHLPHHLHPGPYGT
jgi:hypothetical protein